MTLSVALPWGRWTPAWKTWAADPASVVRRGSPDVGSFGCPRPARRWRDSTGDEQAYRRLEEYIDAAVNGLLRNRTITLFDDRRPRIVDGNKRTIAIYEASSDPD